MQWEYKFGDRVRLESGALVQIVQLTSWYSAALNMNLPKYIVCGVFGGKLDTVRFDIHEYAITKIVA